jgi:hypothetical protein
VETVPAIVMGEEGGVTIAGVLFAIFFGLLDATALPFLLITRGSVVSSLSSGVCTGVAEGPVTVTGTEVSATGALMGAVPGTASAVEKTNPFPPFFNMSRRDISANRQGKNA